MSDFATPWTLARQAPLSSTVCQGLGEFIFIESVMLSHHLILCHHLLFSPSIFPASWSFLMSWLFESGGQCWSFSFSISPSNEYSGLISLFPLGLTGLISLQFKDMCRVRDISFLSVLCSSPTEAYFSSASLRTLRESWMKQTLPLLRKEKPTFPTFLPLQIEFFCSQKEDSYKFQKI